MTPSVPRDPSPIWSPTEISAAPCATATLAIALNPDAAFSPLPTSITRLLTVVDLSGEVNDLLKALRKPAAASVCTSPAPAISLIVSVLPADAFQPLGRSSARRARLNSTGTIGEV